MSDIRANWTMHSRSHREPKKSIYYGQQMLDLGKTKSLEPLAAVDSI